MIKRIYKNSSSKISPIRKKIMLAVLVPAVFFYLLMTLACLYFSFFLVFSEIRSGHVQEALYTSALIDANIRDLTLIGESISQLVARNENAGKNDIFNYLMMQSGNNNSILGFGINIYESGLEKESCYWVVNGNEAVEGDYLEGVRQDVRNEIDDLVKNKTKNIRWVTDTEPNNIEYFQTTLLVSVFSSRSDYIISINIDGNKLCSCCDSNSVTFCREVFSLSHSQSQSNYKEGGKGRECFVEHFTLRDSRGATIYTKGKSAKKHRLLKDQIYMMPQMEFRSNFFNYQEIKHIGFFDFVVKSSIERIKEDLPNAVFLNILNKVCLHKEVVYFRFSMNGRIYWSTAVPIKSADFMLTTYMLENEIMQPIYNQLLSCLLLTISAVFIAVFSLWGFSGRIVMPINKLKDTVNDYVAAIESKAIFNESLDKVDKVDEVDSLKESFDRLVQCLDERGNELYNARANNISYLASQLSGRYFCVNLDCRGYVTHVSRSVESVLGFKKNEFSGLFEKYVFDRDEGDFFRDKLKGVINGEWNDAFEVKLRHKDGSVRCVELFFCLMPGIKLKQKTIEGMVNDITKRVIDTEKFKSLIASAPDAVIITNSDGIISLVNKKVTDVFGYESCELVNMPSEIFFSPSVRYKLSLLGGVDFSSPEDQNLEDHESIGVRKNGEKFPIEISSSVISTECECLISIVIRDISERKDIEREIIEQKERAEESDKAKMLFLSNMSHELRTPLNGILGYAQILIKDVSLSDFYKNKVMSMEGCGKHLLSLINNILDMAKIENNNIYIEQKPFNLLSIVNEVQLMTVNSAREKDLFLKFFLDSNVPEYVTGDKLKLRQILINLISNAVKFTEKGGVSVHVSAIGSMVSFSVEDSGIGICDEDREKLFISFAQLAAGRKQGGAGLGLALSHKLVKAMGGELKVDSQKDIGSRFFFSVLFPLPVNMCLLENGKNNLDMSTDKNAINKSISLLIIENTHAAKNSLVDMLSGGGFTISQVGDINRALKLCRQSLFDLLVVDSSSGYQRENGINHLLCGLPDRLVSKVMVITSDAHQLFKDYDSTCFCGYLEKPFEPNDLLLKVYGCLNADIKIDGKLLPTVNPNKIIFDPNVQHEVLKDIVGKVDERLQIGDVDDIASLAIKWQKKSAYGHYPQDLLNLCKNYDIVALEAFVKEFSDNEGSDTNHTF